MKYVLIVLSILLVLTLKGYAQVVEPVGKDGVANGGYDLVAYFTDGKAVMGQEEFTYETNHVKYRFASRDHLVMFKEAPEKYMPVCNGYCAWGVAAKGKKVPVDPKTFKVMDGKLYLFFNGNFNGSPFNTLPEWNKDEAALLKELPARWAKIER